MEVNSQEAAEPCRKWWIWLVYVILFVLSVPWYMSDEPRALIWWGLPAWVVLSLLITIAIALFTVFVIRRYWQEDSDHPDQRMTGTQQYE